ncbi:MAG: NAD(P)-dependent glycerol-3-phosphate dehydrogenase [Pedosphaera sp.]|nr:NAD(P)-dependent glycerol-3-phosphate dehydrogenase [Pedosphaera sp.]
MNLTLVGAGAWGTALGVLLHQNGHHITVWGHNPEHLEEMKRNRRNQRHLPGVELPQSWRYEPDLPLAAREAETVVLAVPSRCFREISSRMGNFSGTAVSATKGIEFVTGQTMCGILRETMPAARIAALSGPSLALEVARGVPTAVVAASRDPAVAHDVQAWFHRPTFRVYTSDDLAGVELGGALKNVMAIAAGVCDGLGFGDNSKAALLTRSTAEMSRLGVACGARAETFAGLSGLGDLTVTCFSKLSRNRTFGERLGRGEPLDQILASSLNVVEGHPTARAALSLARKHSLYAPIVTEVHGMLYEGKEPRQAVSDLLNRDSRAER